MNGWLKGKSSKPYIHSEGFHVEPQYFPDSLNQQSVSSATLEPDEAHAFHAFSKFTAKKGLFVAKGFSL